MSLKNELEHIRKDIADAAQLVLDEWEQDDDGLNEELGSGGICDRICDAMSSVISNLNGVETTEGGHPGDDHAWLIAYTDTEAFGVNIPASVYETGSGFSWRKIQNARIKPTDIDIWKIDRDLVADWD